jgi:uncharacterized membrane protein YqjE
MSVAVRTEAGRPPAERAAANSSRVAYADAPPIGDLLSDVAGHAQGIVRAEVRLAIEQAREQVNAGVRRVAFLGGAALFGTLGVVLLSVAAIFALATVVALWLAVLIVAAVVLVAAFALVAAANRPSIDATGDGTSGRAT